MTFFSEILKALSSEAGTAIRYTVVAGQGGYFQNVKKILEFSPERIVLRGKKKSVSVEGAELSLGKYVGGDVAVSGVIRKVEEVE